MSASDSFRFPAVTVKTDYDYNTEEYDNSLRLTPEHSTQTTHKIRVRSEAEAMTWQQQQQQRLCDGGGEGISDVRVDSFAESWGVKGGSGRFRETPPSRYTQRLAKDHRAKVYNVESSPVCESRSPNLVSPRTPTFNSSGGKFGMWQAFLSYDACFRLCLNAWARGCEEAQIFLDKECALLREAFGLQKVLLQPEDELLTNYSPELSQELEFTMTPKRTAAKIRVQVRKLKVISDTSADFGACSIKALANKVESAFQRFRDMHSTFSSDRKSCEKDQIPCQASEAESSSCLSVRSKSVKLSGRYIKHMLKSMKSNASENSLTSNLKEPENYSCKLRLRSYGEMDAIQVQPGSSEPHIFSIESLADDLIVEVLDSEGKTFGQVLAQVATMLEDPGDRFIWVPIYHEPDHKLMGRLQLHVTTSNNHEGNTKLQCGPIAETLAYDLVMETGMKEQNFHQRNLLLDESWVWLLGEFASYYGVSDVYTKLRYVSYIMEVATPTAYCLSLVHDLLLPVYMKGQKIGTLSYQEKRMLGKIEDQLERVLGLVFENYKSLDESSTSGILDSVVLASGFAAPALEPAVALYRQIHDVSSPEVQISLCRYFQAAARKRLRRHLAETDEYVSSGNGEETLLSSASLNVAYRKMATVCQNIRQEIITDIEIYNHNIIPSFIDLPNLSASIFSTELSNRLRSFLAACPPPGPSSPVAELVIETSDLQRDISDWGISDIKGGIDSKELFHPYIMLWIQNMRDSLLASCKLDKVKWAGIRTEHATTPFLDKMYNHLEKTLADFEVIIFRWPEYILPLENAVADVEKETVASLEIQYADDIAPLMEIINPSRISFKYIQKLSQRSVSCYTVSSDLGIIMNSMKRMLDVLHPEVEARVKLWASSFPCNGSTAPGDRLSEITVMLRAKFRDYTKAVAELLAANAKLQRITKIKTILQESKNHSESSEIISRMQPLVNLLAETIVQLNEVFEPRVFIQVCRVLWNRMGQEVQSFLDSKRESDSWYKGSRIVISVLDDLFVSKMQQLHADLIELKDLEAPQVVADVHSMLSKENKMCI